MEIVKISCTVEVVSCFLRSNGEPSGQVLRGAGELVIPLCSEVRVYSYGPNKGNFKFKSEWQSERGDFLQQRVSLSLWVQLQKESHSQSPRAKTSKFKVHTTPLLYRFNEGITFSVFRFVTVFRFGFMSVLSS